MSLEPPKPGQVVLGSFRVERLLGAGTYAIAYLAQQLGTDRRAIIKLPHPYLLDGPHAAEIRRRFEVEARAAARVSHPNIATVYTVGHTPQGLPAMAMEFVDGDPLSSQLSGAAPLPLVQIGALGEQIGEALMALHEVGIIRRDLSPANVMIHQGNGGLTAKLLDVDVAKLLGTPSRTVGPMGTPGYFAPELLQGRVTPRCDVYSLGAILWWALTGFERPDDSSDSSPGRRINCPPVGPNPLAVRPDAPPGLAAIVSHMLAAHERRPSVDEFLREWRSALDASAAPRIHAVSTSYTTPMRMQKVAVVVGNGVLRNLTTNYLNLGRTIEIVPCGPRDLTRANPGDYAAAVIDAELPGVDVCELLRMLKDCHERLELIVIGPAARAATRWASYGAKTFVKLPEELNRLPKEVLLALGRTTTTELPNTTRLSTSVIARLRAQGQLYPCLQSFVGHMPQWIGDLQVGLETRDRSRAAQACGALLASVDELGLRDLTQLAQAALAFIKQDDLLSATSFVQAIEQAYHEVFAEVFLLIRQLAAAEPVTVRRETNATPLPPTRPGHNTTVRINNGSVTNNVSWTPGARPSAPWR
jgi:tRNA A-37 threonylcarbamoyl transferase component Bud32/CheY-like chemotaxis protein